MNEFFVGLSIIVTIIVIYYYWLTGYHGRAIQSLLKINVELRKIRNDINTLEQRKKDFEPFYQEPYGEWVMSLNKDISNINRQYHDNYREYLAKRRTVSSRPNNKLNHIFNFLVYGIQQTRQIKSDTQKIYVSVQMLPAGITKIEQKIKNMHNLPWQTSLRFIDLVGKLDEIPNNLTFLRKNGIGGKKINDGEAHYEKLRVEICKIPDDFYKNEQRDIAKLNNPIIVTINAFEVIKNISWACDNLLSESVKWKKSYNETVALVATANKALNDVQRKFKLLPRFLELEKERKELESFTKICARLQLLQKTSLEDLEQIALDAKQSEQNITRLAALLNYHDQQYQKLTTRHGKVLPHVESRQAGFNSQTSQFKHPIKWDISQQRLDAVLEKWKSIEALEIMRTPQKVNDDIDTLDAIESALSALDTTYERIISQARILRQGWDKIIHIRVSVWETAVDDLIKQVEPYSLDNWDPKERVGYLDWDKWDLIHRSQQVVPDNEGTSISEKEVPNLYKNVNNLSRDIDNFEGRQKSIQAKLIIIVDQQKNARLIIENTLPILAVLISEINSHNLSMEIQNEWGLLKFQGENLRDQILISKRERIEIKFQNTGRWKKDVLEKGRLFVSSIKKELENTQNFVVTRLSVLKKLARDVQHPDVTEASIYAANSLFVGEISFTSAEELDQIVNQVRSILKKRDEIMGIANKLRLASSSLTNTYSEVEKEKRNAKDLLDKAQRQASRSWPPVFEDCRPIEEAENLEDIEKQINIISNQSQPIASLAVEYLNIRNQYASIGAKIKDKMRKDDEKQILFLNLAKELKRKIRLLAKQTSEENLTEAQLISLESRNLEILEYIKQQYIQGKMHASAVEKFIEGLLYSGMMKLDNSTHKIIIESEGGPIFFGKVDNRHGAISGSRDFSQPS